MNTPQYRFTFSEEFLLTANLRYRQQIPWCNLFYKARRFLAFIFLALSVFFAVIAKFRLLVPFVIIAGLLFFGQQIDAWFLRSQFRKSPYYNDEVTLTFSDEGLYTTGCVSETRIGWKLFTKARRFPDGLLIFQGSQMFNWLPHTVAVDALALAEVEQLIRSHVKDFCDV